MTTVLAIDQGTSGTKALVLSADDRVLAVAEETVRPSYLPGGGVEQDPAALLESVLTAGRRAVAAAGVDIDVVALANQGETVLSWDPVTGAALSPAIGWQDRRSESICTELAGDAAWIAARTGLVLDPYFSAPKMAWLRRNGFRDGVVTTTDSWLVHRLTGAFVTDSSTASRSLLTDLDTIAWDPELSAVFGLADELMPTIEPSDRVVGRTGAFGAEIPVAGLAVDQQAALIAQRCLDPGTAKCTFGTGAFLLVNVGETAVRSAAGLTTSVAWQTGGQTRYCVDGQVYTAGSVVRWLVDMGLLSDPTALDAAAGTDAGGVYFVPALAGLAAPWWRPDATATLTGMTLSTRPGNLVRAAIEGIAAQVAELVDRVAADAGSPLTTVRVDGGLTRSAVLMQAVADLTRLPVEVYPSPHATALGAAALARAAVDPTVDLADVIPAWTATAGYQPRWSADRADSFRETWRRVVDLGQSA